MYKVKIGDEKMTYRVASTSQDIRQVKNQQQDTQELPIQTGDVFEGKVTTIDKNSLTIEFTKNNKSEQLTIATQSAPELSVDDSVCVSVISYTKDSLKLSITKLSAESIQSIQNHNPITQKVNMDDLKKTLVDTNNPLQYSKQLEQHIEQTITQVDTMLKSFTDEELATLINENYDVTKMSLEVLYQVGHSPRIDKKIALIGDKNYEMSITVNDVAIKQLIDEGVKSNGLVRIPEEQLKQIMEALAHNDIVPNMKNVEKVVNFTEKVDKIKDIDTNKIIQFLASDKENTIGEIYKSLFISKSKEKVNVMSEKDYQDIKSDVQAIIDNKFPETIEKDDLYTIAKTIVVKGLPLNERALDVIGFVKSETSKEETIRIAVEQLKKNAKPDDVLITNQKNASQLLSKEEVANTLSVLQQATTLMVEELSAEEKPITIQALSQKMPEMSLLVTEKNRKDQINLEVINKVENKIENKIENKVPLSREIENLEILRYQMTFKAAMRLNIEGVDLANTQLDELRAKIEGFSTEFMHGDAATVSSSVNSSSKVEETMIVEVNRHFALINGGSTASIARIALESSSEESIASITQKVERGVDRYDQLRTMPRPDLGDNIEKAFSNVDAILEDLLLETTTFNRRAVEILGRNEMPITEDTINSVKVLDVQLQELIGRLVPEHVKELISNKVDVLNEPIENMLKFVLDKDAKMQTNIEDTVAKSLYQMFQKDELSSEQRNGLMGVYRMINSIENSKGAAIGFLVERQLPVTFESLFDASNYIRLSKGSSMMNNVINDDFGKLESLQKDGMTIKEQIRSGYFEKEKALNEGLRAVLQGNQLDNFSSNEKETTAINQKLMTEAISREINSQNVLFGNPTLNDSTKNTLKDIYDAVVKQEVEQLKAILDEINPKQKALIKEGLLMSESSRQSLSINDWKAMHQMDKDMFALKPMLNSFMEQISPMESLDKAFKNAMETLLNDPSQAGKERFETSLKALIDETKKESIKQVLDDNVMQSVRQSGKLLDASAPKPLSDLARDIEGQLLIQRNLMKEDYLHIPVMVNGQMQQMNMYFLNRENNTVSQEDSMSIYFSFSTQHIGTTNVRVQLVGDDVDVTLFATSDRGNQKVKDSEAQFLALFDRIGFSVNKLKFDSFKVPKAVGQDTGDIQSKQVRKYQESRYEKTV